MPSNLNIVICGLSLSSSWGNGHATTYRHLVDALCRRGHEVLFLERDVPWYAQNRDLADPPYGKLRLYQSVEECIERFGDAIRRADLTIVGSYVPDGIEVGRWVLENAGGVTAFYDIDTPITLEALASGACAYLGRDQVAQYDMYLSFSGGRALKILSQQYGAPHAFPLYCSVDPEHYFPEPIETQYDMGYLGTYSTDRQPGLDRLMLDPARDWPEGRFLVGGPQYPESVRWPANVRHRDHIPPAEHREFYNAGRFTLNITRDAMRSLGHSPSIRLFEAAACGAAIISDTWPGLNDFFRIGSEILVAENSAQCLTILRDMPDADRRTLAQRARRRVLDAHTGHHRAVELEQYVETVRQVSTGRSM